MRADRLLLANVVLVVAVLTLGGCGGTDSVVLKASDQGLLTGSPLKSLPPKTVILEAFTDDRGVEPTVIKSVKNAAGTVLFKVDKPVADIVRDAIRQELERNGHQCVTTGTATRADYRISGSVYQYWSTFIRGDGGFVLYSTGDVGVKILATRVAPTPANFSKKYTGTHRYSSMWAITPNMQQEILHQAFLNMLRDFTTDPEFLAFLADR